MGIGSRKRMGGFFPARKFFAKKFSPSVAIAPTEAGKKPPARFALGGSCEFGR